MATKIRLTKPQHKVLAALPADGSTLSDDALARTAFGAIASGSLTQTLNGLVKRGLIEGSRTQGWKLTAEGIAAAQIL